MTSAFSWLNDLVQWVAKLFPRLTLVPPTHHCVLFSWKGEAKSKGKGLVIWWPIAQHIRVLPATTISIQVGARLMGSQDVRPGQLAPSGDSCGMMAEYRIVDFVRCATETMDHRRLLSNRLQSELGKHWADAPDAWGACAAVRESANADIGAFGLKVERCLPVQVGTVVAVLKMEDFYDGEFELGMEGVVEG